MPIIHALYHPLTLKKHAIIIFFSPSAPLKMKQNMTGTNNAIEIVEDDISYKEIITKKLNSLEREVTICTF